MGRQLSGELERDLARHFQGWLARALRLAPSEKDSVERALSEIYSLSARPKPQIIWSSGPSAMLDSALAFNQRPPAAVNAAHPVLAAMTLRKAEGKGNAGCLLSSVALGARRLSRRLAAAPAGTADTARRLAVKERLSTDLARILRPVGLCAEQALAGWCAGERQKQQTPFSRRSRALQARRFLAGEIVWGAWSLYDLAEYAFWAREIVRSYPQDQNVRTFICWLTIAAGAPAYLFFEKAVFVSESPVGLSLDGEGRLHNESGPALAFGDGLAVYALNGITVPPVAVLDASQIDPRSILTETDAERRRILIERYGLARLLASSHARVVDNSRFGTLLHVPLEGGEPMSYLNVFDASAACDGRRREYFIRVPPWMSSAHQAAAWTFKMVPQDYNPHRES